LDPIPAQKNRQVEANSDDEADPELVELLRQHFGLIENKWGDIESGVSPLICLKRSLAVRC
jgi:hypothetical protein